MGNIKRKQVVIAGGGIGGLAAALACARRGLAVQLLERAHSFGEVGAGIQIGPHVTRLLQAWGLQEALTRVASFPQSLQARDARTGHVLGQLRLRERSQAMYGTPYATLHRADLHALLWTAAQNAGVQAALGQTMVGFRESNDEVWVQSASGQSWGADALIGADGVWSVVRQQLLADEPVRFTGHLAFRALVPLADWPGGSGSDMDTDKIKVWMGPHLHVVHYPVQAGRALNIVAIVHGDQPANPNDWDHAGHTDTLMQAMGSVCGPLRQRLEAIAAWRLWALHDRTPVRSASQMAQGRVALLGDAAHPMRPYLAQGAGMAIEDAHALAQCLAARSPLGASVPQQLQAYAEQRWARNARVQAHAIRNGQIFHATGAVALGRNLSLRLLGERVMDMPWLYGGGPPIDR